eukprot:TRINITY_DN2455_c0_g4_i1.p1 TRINITY_DN2455_c0_g4~~TRINITY_DN2455_c0_g4_i1.p1  ORF type:complete len:1556 (-),score=275.43 TRINITY_DN2455_c0_g4_i1:1951-6618(-)
MEGEEEPQEVLTGSRPNGDADDSSSSSSSSSSDVRNVHTRILNDLYRHLHLSRHHIGNYASLGAFLLFAMVYGAVLYLQADAQKGFEISNAHQSLLPPGWTGDTPVVFPNSPSDVLGWINSSIVQNIWATPPCGDGVCSTPAEYPSFGQFGCTADCGVLKNLTSISVILSNDFSSEVARASSSWNLILKAPVSLTWYATNQPFPALRYNNNVTTLAVPDGDWELLLNAPYGGVVGLVELYFANGTSHNTSERVPALTTFGGCLADQGQYAVCREMSAVIAAYLVGTCEEGPLSNSTLALLRRDWSSFCETEPDVVIQLLNSTGNYTPTYEYMATLGVDPFLSRTVLQCACPPGYITKITAPGSTCKELLRDYLAYGLLLEELNSTGICGTTVSSSIRPETVVCISTGGKSSTVLSSAAAAAPASAPSPSGVYDDYYGSGVSARVTQWALHATPEAPLWESLGPTNEARNATLSVAIYRALAALEADACHTWTTNPSRPLHSVNLLFNWTALYIGGPAPGNGTFYYLYGALSGNSISSTVDLAKEIYDRHHLQDSGHAPIGQDSIDRFSDILLAAIFSSVTLATETRVAFYNWFHQLDGVIKSSDAQTCDQPDYVLQWATGSTLSTRITNLPATRRREVPGYVIVQWVWADDNPHSINAFTYEYDSTEYYSAFGVDTTDFVPGTGAASKVLSRSTQCTPANRYFDFTKPDEIIPCALVTPSQLAGTFSYSTGFSAKFGSVEYGSEGAADASNLGFLYLDPLALARISAPAAAPGPAPASTNTLNFVCNSACNITRISNGVCDEQCNNPDCLFDGGDCSCKHDAYGLSQCPCPGNQTRAADDGSCCLGDAVGSALTFDFNLRTFGPNTAASDATFVPGTSTPVTRTVANANTVVIGLLISQKRTEVINCDAQSRFQAIVSGFNCWGAESTSPWGIASPFLPSALLYNKTYAREQAALYAQYKEANSSLAREDFNVNGSPNGFLIPTIQSADNSTKQMGKHYILDINLDLALATKHMQYINDGYFYDGQTTSSTVQLVTYNAQEQSFTLVKCELTFQVGGKVVVKCSVDTARLGLYRRGEDKVRLVLELLFLVGVALSVLLEVREAFKTKKDTGKFSNYFQNTWQIIDLLSIFIMIAVIALWIYHVLAQARPFRTSLRYNIYRFLPGDYFRLLTPADTGDGSTSALPEALQVFSKLDSLIKFKIFYFALNGVNVFLVVLRVLKFMDFQPRMGTITRTLTEASTNLFHFFILGAILFLGYAVFGNIAFGGQIDQFRTIAITFDTMLTALNGDDTVDTFFVQLSGWSLYVAVLYWWSFIVLIMYITFNLLIAIVVDAYASVKDSVGNPPSIFAELAFIIVGLFQYHSSKGPFRTNKQVEKELQRLGATDEGEHDELESSILQAENHGPMCASKKGLPNTIRLGEQLYEVWEVERAIKDAAKSKSDEGTKLHAGTRAGKESGDMEADPDVLAAYADHLTHAVVAHCEAVAGPASEEPNGDKDGVIVASGIEAVVSKLEEPMEAAQAAQRALQSYNEVLEAKMATITNAMALVFHEGSGQQV